MKTFVINLDHRNDRWVDINAAFRTSGLKLERTPGVNGKLLSEDVIKDSTTGTCNQLCSPGMIGCWFSHYNTWKKIVAEGIPYALILEDDAVPVDNFRERFDKCLSEIPSDYDFCYVGCIGTCGPTGGVIANILGMENKSVNDCVMIPAFPLALHAYLITYAGAKRLIESPFFQKVLYHVDFALALWYRFNPDFRVYAFKESLINQALGVPSDIANNDHPVLSSIFSHVQFGNFNLAIMLNTQWANIRKLGIPITGYTVLFALVSLIIGATLDLRGILIHLCLMIALGVSDVIKSRKTTAVAMLDVMVAMMFIYIGLLFRKK